MTACGATNRQGEPCQRPAMVGQRRCRYHGGASPQARQAARQRLAVAKALRVVEREGVEVIASPLRTLQELAGESLAIKRYFADRLEALEALRYEGREGEQLRAEVALYERALDRAQKFALDLAGLSEPN